MPQDRPEPSPDGGGRRPRGRYLFALSLAALGVVYGDIGTSPLYAFRECFNPAHGLTPDRSSVLGTLSLIFWSLLLVVSLKYLAFVMRADNRGEGGILALMALVLRKAPARRRQGLLLAAGLFGAALLYGDGVITPAISVLGAVEGVAVVSPALDHLVLPIALAILVALFLLQKRGTARVGAMFGPFTLVWFLAIAALGVWGIVREPHVLWALSPHHGVRFFAEHGFRAFLVLGAIFLVVTGAEALYADMGHFGRRPIRLAWFGLVLPSLVLNYFGQGALLLRSPEAAESPFYLLAPAWARIPLVVLSTGAACIASQAVISGAFSLARQTVQLGYSPRLEIVHTSAREIGQIFVPAVNWALLAAVSALVIGFRRSGALAAAYGIAVTTTMVITTFLAYFVARDVWRWRAALALPVVAAFLAVDLSFFGANVLKIDEGGWFPLALAAGVYTLMSSWKRGRQLLAQRLREAALPLETFLHGFGAEPPVRVGGTAIFMTGNPEGVPSALLHNLKHNKVLHERVLLLTILTEEVPVVPPDERVQIQKLEHGLLRVVARYGFMEHPDVPEILARCRKLGLEVRPMEATFFLGRETLLPSHRPGMALWREALFAWMSRNARSPTAFFNIPPNRVVELGAQIEL
ncbi:MAG: potassium transporter Kup [Myxococcales bacterium]|nr:potassium transporter Kup [Myxococcales bacterium]